MITAHILLGLFRRHVYRPPYRGPLKLLGSSICKLVIHLSVARSLLVVFRLQSYPIEPLPSVFIVENQSASSEKVRNLFLSGAGRLRCSGQLSNALGPTCVDW